MRISRRAFVAGTAALPFAVWFERAARAQTPFTRYAATSRQGKAMLRIYADAVGKMQSSIAENDPRSWLFQWYTHFVRRDRTKPDEISRVFGGGSSPQKALAGEMWNTCQAHSSGQDSNDFLPWHRMYVYFFERIVRHASGEPTFALPYWNYSVAGNEHGRIPREFRDTGIAPLPVSDRNPGVNRGDAIATELSRQLATTALREREYVPRSRTRQGFCRAIDSGLHGNVHVLVGNPANMGDVPWAAKDPIFWLHHCNIDRLWESWNRNGGRNPTDAWLDHEFVFADENGARVAAKVRDFLDIARLGYAYDQLEPRPPGFSPLGPGETGPFAAPVAVARTTEAVPLEAARVRAPLARAAGPLRPRLEALPAGRRLHVVLEGLAAQVQPGVVYDVYFDLPPDAAPAADVHLVGTFNFFDAVAHAGHHGDHGAGANDRFVSFDVTEAANELRAAGRLSDEPSVTLVRSGEANAAARPVVGKISVVEG